MNIKPSFDLEALKKTETNYFVNTRQSQGLMKDLYNSFTDLHTCGMNLLKIKEQLRDITPTKVKDKLENLNALVDVLIEDLDIKKEDPRENPSKEFKQYISDVLLQCAKHVEYYSLQMTRIIETNNCLHATEKQMLKLG